MSPSNHIAKQPLPPLPKERNAVLPFSKVSNIQPLTSHTYKAAVHPDWSFGPAAHGGFLVALLWKAIALHFSTTLQTYTQPDTTSLHIEFLRATGHGDVTIEIKDVRLGRGTSTVHATLTQGGVERCVAYATNGRTSSSSLGNISMPMEYRPDPIPPPIHFDMVLRGSDEFWIRYDILKTPTARNLALGNVIFAMQRDPPKDVVGKRLNQQWICPRREGETWKTDMLGILMDLAVPPLENYYPNPGEAPNAPLNMSARAVSHEREGRSSYDHPGWAASRFYPTVNMTIEVKRQLPPEGEKWLFLRWHTKEVVEGRFDADIEVWDLGGRLVASATSLWYVVDAKRTPARALERERSKGKGQGESKM